MKYFIGILLSFFLFCNFVEAGTSLSAVAFGNDRKGIKLSIDEKNAIRQAIAERNYEAWRMATAGKTLDGPWLLITKDNFEKFAESWEALIAGDLDKAEQLREEIGLPPVSNMKERRDYVRNSRGVRQKFSSKEITETDYILEPETEFE